MIVPTLNTVPAGIGRLMPPALPAVEAVRAVRPVAPDVERGLDGTSRRDRARASLRARVALGLDAVLGLAERKADGQDSDEDTSQRVAGFIDTLEAALQAVADADAKPDAGTAADRLSLLVRLAYGTHDDGFARLVERLGSAGIEREIPALRPLLGELAAHFEQLAARRPRTVGRPPTLARLLVTVAEQPGDLVSAEA